MNFKKLLAGACAGAMVLGMCAMPAYAAIEGADGNGNYLVDVATLIGNADINDVYGVKITFTEESVADMMTNGAGGGFIFSTASNNWNQLQWCNGCAEEIHDIQLDADTNSITRMEETPFFTAEDISGADGTYGQIVLCQWWGGDIVIENIELLDKDGNVIDTAAESDPTVEEPATEEPATEESTVEKPATEESTVEEPATEESTVEEPTTVDPSGNDTTDTPTGDTAPIAILAVAAVAAMGAAVVTLRKKENA